MTPSDRVAKLLRETRGQPSEGDLRQMVEEAEQDALTVAATHLNGLAHHCENEATKANVRACAQEVTLLRVLAPRALARERK